MNYEKAMRVLEEGCELTLDSLEMALKENKERGVIDCHHAPAVRDLMIAFEKDLKAKKLLRELEMNEGEGQGTLRDSGNYGRSMDAGGGGEYGRPRRPNGRWMDGQPGGGYYSSYGHEEDSTETLRRMINDTQDQHERKALEQALNAMRK